MTTIERKEHFYEFVSNLSAKSKKRYLVGLERAYKQLAERCPRKFKKYISIYDIDNIQILNKIKDEPEFHKRNTQGGTAEYRGLNLYIQYLYTIEDSYQAFLNYFEIDKSDFFNWGINNAIFPKDKEIKTEWNNLLERITTGSDDVYIRGYGRDAKNTELFIDMYKILFPLAKVKKDGTNNAKPKKNLEKMTLLKRNENLFNYQISHIFGNTKNIFLFEAPWNICYLPKLIDPFSGHEAKGLLPPIFQKKFQKKTSAKYRKYIKEYRALLDDFDVENRMNHYFADIKSKPRYARDTEYRNMINQFENDAYEEFFSILA